MLIYYNKIYTNILILSCCLDKWAGSSHQQNNYLLFFLYQVQNLSGLWNSLVCFFFFTKDCPLVLRYSLLTKEKHPKEDKHIHCNAFYQDFEHVKSLQAKGLLSTTVVYVLMHFVVKAWTRRECGSWEGNHVVLLLYFCWDLWW